MGIKEQEIIIDFLEMDHIRQAINDAAKLYGFKSKSRERYFYKRSSFYIGRGVTVLKFNDCRNEDNYSIVDKVTQYVAAQFPEYKFFSTTFGTIFVYLRGSDKRKIHL